MSNELMHNLREYEKQHLHIFLLLHYDVFLNICLAAFCPGLLVFLLLLSSDDRMILICHRVEMTSSGPGLISLLGDNISV